MLQLLYEYDLVLKNHLKEYGNKGKGNPFYISKTIFYEVIHLLKTNVLHFIINEIQIISKYCPNIMDSISDLSK